MIRNVSVQNNGNDDHYLNIIESRSKGYSIMPVVGTRTRKMSC